MRFAVAVTFQNGSLVPHFVNVFVMEGTENEAEVVLDYESMTIFPDVEYAVNVADAVHRALVYRQGEIHRYREPIELFESQKAHFPDVIPVVTVEMIGTTTIKEFK